jgi:folylpolyglutamate synthase
MVESVLRHSGYTTGLFTSPHLADVRERVRLCGRPLPKERFAAHFWAARDALLEAARKAEQEAEGAVNGDPSSPKAVVGMPGYFRFLTLLGLRIFLQEPCPPALPSAATTTTTPSPPDAVVLEVGIGGRLDATNVVNKPAAVGIASLGFDHMELLGDTLPQIAAEKAGVIKRGAPVFTVEQPQDAAAVLARFAREVGACPPEARVAKPLNSYEREDGSSDTVPLGLRGEHQRANAALAVALASAWEKQWVAAQQQSSSSVTPERLKRAEERVRLLEKGVLPVEYLEGLAATVWPGRSQVVPEAEFLVGEGKSGGSSSSSRLTFYLDGAHTPESMASCAQWFAEEAGEGEGEGGDAQKKTKTLRFLFFNCTRERAPAALLPALVTGLAARGAAPHAALFVPPDSQYGFLAASPSSDERSARARADLSWQRALRDEWDILALASSSSSSSSSSSGGGHQEGFDVGSALAALPRLEPDVGEGEEEGGKAAAAAAAAAALSLGRGAVVPGGVAEAVAWLRECARSDPELCIKVLVTGSLYLVGDVLRALDHAPK